MKFQRGAMNKIATESSFSPSDIGQQDIEPSNETVQDPALGDILRRTKGLTNEQVEEALHYQREHGVRFGEAAVALGFARQEDITWALAQQFHYPYYPTGEDRLHEDLVVANEPFGEEVESFRDVRSQLLMSVLAEGELRSALAIVSPNVGDGKSFIAANLAVAFSQLPGRTLLIDADLRSPRLHQVFGVDSSRGLAGILSGRAEQRVIRPIKQLPNLFLLPVGVTPPNPSELVQQPAMSLMLRELLTKFDYVLVDTPAASKGADARIIATHCGAALVVGRRNSTSVPALQHLVKQLGKGSVRVAGMLVNEY